VERGAESVCPRRGCGGHLVIQRCGGNGGFPVTHFWRADGSTVYFEAKGRHDHPAPEQRWARTGLVDASRTAVAKVRSVSVALHQTCPWVHFV